jgi:hypothetical protein
MIGCVLAGIIFGYSVKLLNRPRKYAVPAKAIGNLKELQKRQKELMLEKTKLTAQSDEIETEMSLSERKRHLTTLDSFVKVLTNSH